LKHGGIKALVDHDYLREQSVDLWNVAIGDLWPQEKNLEEISMFVHF
jgi:hypothetical protein